MSSSSRRGGTWIAALAILGPVIGYVVWASFQVGQVECEACVRYEGRELCRTVSAENGELALRSAIDNACALLASGMTETIRCSSTPPVRASCGTPGG